MVDRRRRGYRLQPRVSRVHRARQSCIPGVAGGSWVYEGHPVASIDPPASAIVAARRVAEAGDAYGLFGGGFEWVIGYVEIRAVR